MIDSITFETKDCAVQIIDEKVLFWSGIGYLHSISLDDLLNIAAFAIEYRQANMEKVIDHEL